MADADAMAHINGIGSLFHLAYKEKGMEIDEGIEWIKCKIERDWKKMSERSREIYKEKYENIMSILG